MMRVIIVGAGFGGLVAAAELAKSGMDVTILEAHNLPGGCASTFYYQGYQFDCGATLAGGFAPGASMDFLGKRLGISWEVQDVYRAMDVHLPNEQTITRWTDHELWIQERTDAFGEASTRFWEWQEQTADTLWDLALQLPTWPPQSYTDLISLFNKGLIFVSDKRKLYYTHQLISLFFDSTRPIINHLRGASPLLKLFVDAQLLIASQTTSAHANALYGAVALDLPRQGVVEVPGGIVSLANQLQKAIEGFGGSIKYHNEVTHISHVNDGRYIVHTHHGYEYPTDIIIFNLPPWNIKLLAKEINIKKLRSLAPLSSDAWGAFTLYIGVESLNLPRDISNHHQIIIAEPLGEGNSIFLSLSPDGDYTRASEGCRALTISTHTRVGEWWRLYKQSKDLYEQRKQKYIETILDHAELILPGLRTAARLILPGTPITFQRFTKRELGWVGGFPQTSLFNVWGPRLSKDIYMVGDSIFPGQSIAAVSLGGIRVAKQIIAGYQS